MTNNAGEKSNPFASPMAFNMLPPQKQIEALFQQVNVQGARLNFMQAQQASLQGLLFNHAIAFMKSILTGMDSESAANLMKEFQAVIDGKEKPKGESKLEQKIIKG
jgi:hypothetical protein